MSRHGFSARSTLKPTPIGVDKAVLVLGGVTNTVWTKTRTGAGASSTRYPGAAADGNARYSRSSSTPALEANALHRAIAAGAEAHSTIGVPAARARIIRFEARRSAGDHFRSTRTAPGGLMTNQLFRQRSSPITTLSIQNSEGPKPGHRARDVVVAQDTERVVNPSVVELFDLGRGGLGVVEALGHPSPRIAS